MPRMKPEVGARDPDRGGIRALGLGIVTGAAADDPSAIGTYASAGARVGPGFLWTAPLAFPMMFAVVYLSAKLGQVSGQGLFGVLRGHFPRWVLGLAFGMMLVGNTVEAAADLGGMAAGINLLVPVPFTVTVIAIAVVILILQIAGTYRLIRTVFRWLALLLLAYVAAALLAKPDLGEVIAGTFLPRIRFDREFLALLVAVIGTTLSAYLYTWQTNTEVEEEIEQGRTTIAERRGATDGELRRSRRDLAIGMAFSNLIMYFVILATASTLFRAGQHDIASAADAARALEPVAGRAASALFALGIVAVGFLAVPVMTTGVAYNVAQTLGWRHGLSTRFRQARRFYYVIIAVTVVAVGLNFLGLNPMRALVWAGIVQGLTTPFFMLVIMLATNRRAVMGERVNGRAVNVLGWATTVTMFAAAIALVLTWWL